MEIAFGLVGVAVLVSNLISIVLQNTLKKETESSFVLITNFVNTTDLTCFVPFALLFIFHFVHKGTFVLHEIIWRASTPCLLIFGCSFAFAVLSPLSLFFMSLSRHMVVLHPIDTVFKDNSFLLKWIGMSVFIIVMLGSLITLLYKYNFSRLPMSLCLPSVDPTDSIW